MLDARVLDEPIADVVLRQCGFAEHADEVLAQIEVEYDTAKEEARRRKRELTLLHQEVDTLKHNLALTRSPDQVAIIFEQIDRRMQRINELADVGNSPAGRILSAAQVATVKAFLADLRLGWKKQPLELRNELFRLILDRVVVEAHPSHVLATIEWRSGARQRLWIERPRRGYGERMRWTEADNAWLCAHYAMATREVLQAQFPHRSYMAIRKQAELLGLRRQQKGIPKPRGARWTDQENTLLQAYAQGLLSTAELLAQMPGRSPDAVSAQLGTLGLKLQQKPIYYRLETDVLEQVSQDDRWKMEW